MPKQKAAYQTEYVPASSGDTTTGLILVDTRAIALNIGGTQNVESAVTVNTAIPIRVSGSRKYGIIARHVVLSRIEVVDTTSRLVYRRVPIFDPSNFSFYLGQINPSITYEGETDWSFVGAMNERYHLFFGV